MKRQLLFGLVISVLALWVSMKDVDFPRMMEALGRAHYWWLLPAMGLTMLGYLVRAYRWKFLMLSIKDISTKDLFRATIIGFLANIVLPARLGEIVRPYVIGRRQAISKTAAFATIVVERIFDLSTLMVCFGIVLMLYPQSFPPALRRAGIGMFLANLVLLVLLILMQAHIERAVRVVRWFARPLPGRLIDKVEGLMRSFTEGLGALKSGHHMGMVSLLSIAMWLTIVLSIWCTQQSLSLPLPLYASAVLVVVISVGIMFPSAPGYIGVMQLACSMGLGIFHIDNTLAQTFSWLYLLTQHLPVLAVGLLFMWLEGLSFREMSRVSTGGEAAP
jgi:glycosyltransferase 2 family protein